MSRRRLLAETTAEELGYWRAKERVDGSYGKRQEELRFARQTAHLMAAANPGTEVSVIDCLPTWYQEQEDVIALGQQPAQTEEEMRAIAAAAIAAWNQDDG